MPKFRNFREIRSYFLGKKWLRESLNFKTFCLQSNLTPKVQSQSKSHTSTAMPPIFAPQPRWRLNTARNHFKRRGRAKKTFIEGQTQLNLR